MMRFESPWALLLLALVPLVIYLARRPGRTAALLLPTARLAAMSGRTWRTRLMPALWLLRAAAVALLVVAIARPQLGSGRVQTSTDAVAIQLVVDRSGSMAEPMLYQGSAARRLDVVKHVLTGFVEGNGRGLKGRAADLVGLVSFGSLAETVCPLVRDPKALVDLIDSIQIPTTRAEGQTALGDGLALGAARLQRAEEDLKRRQETGAGDSVTIKSKVIVLLTDGAQTPGLGDHMPIEAAQMCADWGIRVYTIGIGAREGFFDLREFDEPTLQRIAQMTGGVYRRAQDGDALERIYAEIDSLEKTRVQTFEYTDYEERFTTFAAAAAAALAAQVLLSATVLRRLP
ncbi:MAG: VWA domain-containing protein [Phycisphaeraceae bacterium]|nr:VWA domain-containing protein [Phycisphaeraceae bacterium]